MSNQATLRVKHIGGVRKPLSVECRGTETGSLFSVYPQHRLATDGGAWIRQHCVKDDAAKRLARFCDAMQGNVKQVKRGRSY